MFCPNCGANNPDTATVCPQCNQPVPQFTATPQPVQLPPLAPAGVPAAPGMPGAPAPAIPNYLTQSIIMTVFSLLCCTLVAGPFAIIALVYSNQVIPKLAANDIAGALAASQNAKIFNWISFGLTMVGALLGILYLILIFAGVISGLNR